MEEEKAVEDINEELEIAEVDKEEELSDGLYLRNKEGKTFEIKPKVKKSPNIFFFEDMKAGTKIILETSELDMEKLVGYGKWVNDNLPKDLTQRRSYIQ